MHDAAVIGGGVLGCTTALHLARARMRVVLIERRGLFQEASGTNAGTLSMQHFARPDLVPYALRGYELWKGAREWLGDDAGFAAAGGLVLAFTEEEAELLGEKSAEIRDAGSPIEIIGANRAREIEAGLGDSVVLAAYCPLDGQAASNRCGRLFRHALVAAGVEIREGTAVAGIDRDGDGFAVRTSAGLLAARRVVLAGGVWLRAMGRWLGLEVPVSCRPQQMVVTERMPSVLRSVLGVANRRLSVKQADNGTVLIGGGWLGTGGPDDRAYDVIEENLVGNVRLARFAIPALGRARIMRAWVGLREVDADDRPLVGELPGIPGAFIIGCGISGFTIGPFMGRLLADFILGRQPQMPIFDPAVSVRPIGYGVR